MHIWCSKQFHEKSVNGKVQWLYVCLSVCNTIILERLDIKVHFWSAGTSWGDTGQVRIWKSSGQGQGHRNKKTRNFLFQQCKTVIGIKSSSIEERAAKFVNRMPRFSAIENRAVWPPSLSRDRKWPRLNKSTRSLVVWLRLELRT